MATFSRIDAPAPVLTLLSELHEKSIQQERTISDAAKNLMSIINGDPEGKDRSEKAEQEFDQLMLDKFIALDEDKCQFMYQLITAMGATNIVEAGTSFGVSTIYLALAIAKTKVATGKPGVVIATEKEKEKAAIARKYWAQCGPLVEKEIELREGNLLETLKTGLPVIDLLLLDIWTPLALPTLKIVQPHMRPGSVVLADNTISGATGYTDMLKYIKDPTNGFRTLTLPFTNGFEMSVYYPDTA